MENKIKEYGYLQFPLCLLMETYKKDIESALRLILRYGIMYYATKLKYNLSAVAKQLYYYYVRKRKILQSDIVSKLSKAEDNGVIIFEDWNPGFDVKGNFDPDLDLIINPILKLFESDPEMKSGAILNYQLQLCTSNDHLGINIASNDDLIRTYNKALQIQKTFEDKFGRDAMTFCKKSMLFEFINNPKEIDLFRAYIGIKSMIGRRNFVSSNKPAILSRMIGCKSKSAFDYYTSDKCDKDKNLLPAVEKYSKRYHMDNLLLTLAEHKYIMFLSKKDVSVIYLSKYMEPDKLRDLINETKEKQNLQKRIREAGESLI